MKDSSLIELSDYFKSIGIKSDEIYFVGGTSRDYLLGLEVDDFDFASKLSPSKLDKLFNNEEKYSSRYLNYGAVSFKIDSKHITITSMRKEKTYLDHRHPNDIEFITDLNVDSLRRDFTINSIYMDLDLNIYDPNNGQEDLNNKIIRMIGDIPTRIKEDPLRILRAYRFKEKLNFEIEEELNTYICNNFPLLKNIKKEKIALELQKFDKLNAGKIIDLLKDNQIEI